jgi:hypothetical protein
MEKRNVDKDQVVKQVVPDIEPVKVRAKSSIPVNQYSLEGKFIQTFPSIRKASIASKCLDTSIQLCIRGSLRQTGGFQWRKAE